MTENDSIIEYPLSLVAPDGRSIQGVLRLDEEHDILTLEYDGGRLEVVDRDYFEAFCHIRETLESEDLRPFCYGACRNVYPSGMSSDMGGGLRAYRLTLGQRSRMADLVHIFSTGPDVVPVTVSEQREFYSRWLESLGIRV